MTWDSWRKQAYRDIRATLSGLAVKLIIAALAVIGGGSELVGLITG